MFWDDSPRDELAGLRDVVDVAYRIDCPRLPLDHAHALSSALLELLPWLGTEDHAGVHLIHGAESGNGWMRPQDPERDLLHLSRRARLRLRVPVARVDEAATLIGRTLEVSGFGIGVGPMNVIPLEPLPVVFARHVVADPEQDEPAFLAEMAAELGRIGVPASKLLSGLSHVLRVPGGLLHTRSLMVAELDAQSSLRLQRSGVGSDQALGCGLFIGHKDIAPVPGAG
ncbi:CRISPR-associated Cas6-like protein [Thioalkalivibrio nitratireducens DSM 14787]|uniref:CRISPR-associated Cas6-like protein n=1 Tax=Thioalkalivibrio nitratireducens (strain DSM 14787 / UNIQEM 213 / ALEN2) TaxID=1255043 RepID=L0DSG3_THIND|nr:type I-MYXAN CRISPR-associated protein Cas6/Cmx6 [Thioalkalivibrio nitratireducens]AGA32554.1 CRISPR-associated Cas6-like protein [Thioalkalivibrio nitratireducens DSM 14787]